MCPDGLGDGGPEAAHRPLTRVRETITLSLTGKRGSAGPFGLLVPVAARRCGFHPHRLLDGLKARMGMPKRRLCPHPLPKPAV